jgi:hypothetical protein
MECRRGFNFFGAGMAFAAMIDQADKGGVWGALFFAFLFASNLFYATRNHP